MAERNPDALLSELTRLEALRDPRKNAGAGSNRSFERFVVRGDIELHPESRTRLDRNPLDVKIRDLARGGVGFIAQQHMPKGSCWRACFLQHGFVVAQQCLVVRHSREVSPGVFLVGTQFVSDPALLALMGVEPGAIQDGDEQDVIGSVGGDAFVAPSEVA